MSWSSWRYVRGLSADDVIDNWRCAISWRQLKSDPVLWTEVCVSARTMCATMISLGSYPCPCGEEFMHDLFGKSNDDQTTYHNVTAYARHRAPSHAVACTAVTTLEAEVGCKHHLKDTRCNC